MPPLLHPLNQRLSKKFGFIMTKTSPCLIVAPVLNTSRSQTIKNIFFTKKMVGDVTEQNIMTISNPTVENQTSEQQNSSQTCEQQTLIEAETLVLHGLKNEEDRPLTRSRKDELKRSQQSETTQFDMECVNIRKQPKRPSKPKEKTATSNNKVKYSVSSKSSYLEKLMSGNSTMRNSSNMTLGNTLTYNHLPSLTNKRFFSPYHQYSINQNPHYRPMPHNEFVSGQQSLTQHDGAQDQNCPPSQHHAVHYNSQASSQNRYPVPPQQQAFSTTDQRPSHSYQHTSQSSKQSLPPSLYLFPPEHCKLPSDSQTPLSSDKQSMPPGQRSFSTGHHTASHDQHPNPAGQHAISSDEHPNPTGQHTISPDQHQNPTDQAKSSDQHPNPTGQQAKSFDQCANPTGQHTISYGQHQPHSDKQPSAQNQDSLPPGHCQHPSDSRLLSSDKQSIPPSQNSASTRHLKVPTDQLPNPAGQNVITFDQHSKPIGQHTITDQLQLHSDKQGLPQNQYSFPPEHYPQSSGSNPYQSRRHMLHGNQHFLPRGQYPLPQNHGLLSPHQHPLPIYHKTLPPGQHKLHHDHFLPAAQPPFSLSQHTLLSGQHPVPPDQHRLSFGQRKLLPQEHLHPRQHLPYAPHHPAPAQHLLKTGKDPIRPYQHSLPTDVISMSPNQEQSPSNHKSSPQIVNSFSSGQQSQPSIEHSSPTEQRSSPTGQHSSLAGKHLSPVGQHSSPVGQHSSPAGQHSLPSDQQKQSPHLVSLSSSDNPRSLGQHHSKSNLHSLPSDQHDLPSDPHPFPPNYLSLPPHRKYPLPFPPSFFQSHGIRPPYDFNDFNKNFNCPNYNKMPNYPYPTNNRYPMPLHYDQPRFSNNRLVPHSRLPSPHLYHLQHFVGNNEFHPKATGNEAIDLSYQNKAKETEILRHQDIPIDLSKQVQSLPLETDKSGSLDLSLRGKHKSLKTNAECLSPHQNVQKTCPDEVNSQFKRPKSSANTLHKNCSENSTMPNSLTDDESTAIKKKGSSTEKIRQIKKSNSKPRANVSQKSRRKNSFQPLASCLTSSSSVANAHFNPLIFHPMFRPRLADAFLNQNRANFFPHRPPSHPAFISQDSASRYNPHQCSTVNPTSSNQSRFPSGENPLPFSHHALPSGNCPLPSNQPRMLAGQHPLPLDQQSLNSGQHTLPSDHQTLPSHHHGLPSSQHPVPLDQRSFPTDHHKLPSHQDELSSGQQSIPLDQHSSPPYHHALPSDEHGLSSGQHSLPSVQYPAVTQPPHHQSNSSFNQNLSTICQCDADIEMTCKDKAHHHSAVTPLASSQEKLPEGNNATNQSPVKNFKESEEDPSLIHPVSLFTSASYQEQLARETAEHTDFSEIQISSHQATILPSHMALEEETDMENGNEDQGLTITVNQMSEDEDDVKPDIHLIEIILPINDPMLYEPNEDNGEQYNIVDIKTEKNEIVSDPIIFPAVGENCENKSTKRNGDDLIVNRDFRSPSMDMDITPKMQIDRDGHLMTIGNVENDVDNGIDIDRPSKLAAPSQMNNSDSVKDDGVFLIDDYEDDRWIVNDKMKQFTVEMEELYSDIIKKENRKHGDWNENSISEENNSAMVSFRLNDGNNNGVISDKTMCNFTNEDNNSSEKVVIKVENVDDFDNGAISFPVSINSLVGN